MKFNIAFERVYPQSVDDVWRAITDPVALGSWLMETDFVPEVGAAFQMWCVDSDGDTDHYSCKVLAIEPPARMLWSWLPDGRQSESETFVEFELSEVPYGTRLVVRHSGDRDKKTVDAFKSGWPNKLGRLESVLRSH